MSLAIRIIPTLLFDGQNLVKGQRFMPWRVVGHVEQAARICGMRGVDEIVLLDVKATTQGREPDYALVRRISESIFTPLTVGGGVRKLEHVKRLLHAGADKVAIGTAAVIYGGGNLLEQCRATVGSQAIVVAIDVRGASCWGRNGSQRIPEHIEETVGYVHDAGAGEILLTSIEREGTMVGYDLDLIRRVSKVVDIPVIAHGGCSGYENMLHAIQAGASAVAAGALFQFTDATPRAAAEYLAKHGIETRIPERSDTC